MKRSLMIFGAIAATLVGTNVAVKVARSSGGSVTGVLWLAIGAVTKPFVDIYEFATKPAWADKS